MSMKDNYDDTMDAIWCVDSETGDNVLMCRKTNKELMRVPGPLPITWVSDALICFVLLGGWMLFLYFLGS
jgi:hypothetical protein